MNIAVAIFIFKRPESSKRVLEAVRQVKPSRLFIISDGPRFPEEAEKCLKTQKIFEEIDWNCEILKNYSDTNIGCGYRISTGISWVFEHVEEAIFLEDDCVPDPSFFKFCQELLEHFKDDERIMSICGTNELRQWKAEKQSYHFSNYGHSWGWASWKRAWKYFDFGISKWEDVEVKKAVENVIFDDSQFLFRKKKFDKLFEQPDRDIWDHQWLFARLCQSGLSIVPASNLISNVGFDNEATHTKDKHDKRANLPSSQISFPLKHPFSVAVDREFDAKRFSINYQRSSFRKILERVKRTV